MQFASASLLVYLAVIAGALIASLIRNRRDMRERIPACLVTLSAAPAAACVRALEILDGRSYTLCLAEGLR